MAGGQLIKVMEAAAQKGKIAMLPQYEFAAREVVKGRMVLVGDAAHSRLRPERPRAGILPF